MFLYIVFIIIGFFLLMKGLESPAQQNRRVGTWAGKQRMENPKDPRIV